jgi:hypothetical protein
MDLESLKVRLDNINEKIETLYVGEDSRSEPAYDGIVNPEKYFSAKFKILVMSQNWGDK